MNQSTSKQNQTEDPHIQHLRQRQAQQKALQEQKIRQKLDQMRAEYTYDYAMPLNYPAQVTTLDDDAANKEIAPRTDKDFVNARLLEAGLPLSGGIPELMSGDDTTLKGHSEAVDRFISNLQGTGCYDAVQVYLGNDNAKTTDTSDDQHPNIFDVTVKLKEKNWYKLYIGGGVNSDDLSSIGSTATGGTSSIGGEVSGMLPKLQFETTASLLNITGFADISTASYCVDQTGSTSFKFMHDRPLCSVFSKHSPIYEWLMPPDPRTIHPKQRENQHNNLNEQQVFMSDDTQYALGGGSHTTLGIHAVLDEIDYESTRSYKEFSRSIGIRLANHNRGASRGPGAGTNKPSIAPPESMAGPYVYLDWSAKLRDTLPRRHAEFPFVLDCSKEVACHSGTTMKHSLTGGVYLNGCLTDDRYDPTMGHDLHVTGEVSGPPGDVGYWKVKGGGSWHYPLELLRMVFLGVSDDDTGQEGPTVVGMTFHSSFNAGVIRPLSFGGLCSNTFGKVPLSDRFYVGGPFQLRGFSPAGVGPRASKGGASAPGGDSLGGDLFYTSTFATSIPFPKYFSTLRQNGARIFGFANIGTCVSTEALGSKSLFALSSAPAWSQIMQSSRVAVGGGVSLGLPMGRFEATYAVPLRYGPRDARKAVQFGFGFSFG